MYNCCSVYNPPGGGGGGGTVLGSGTLNYVAKWTPDGTTIGDSQMFDNGTNIGINKFSSFAANTFITIKDPGTLFEDATIYITDFADNLMFVFNNSGKFGIGTDRTPDAYLHVLGTTEQVRVAYSATQYYTTTVSSVGLVQFNATGTSVGFKFLDQVYNNGSSSVNTNSTAFGQDTMVGSSFTGDYNTCFGYNILNNATSANQNTFIGDSVASVATTASNNTGIGRQAMQDLTTGQDNVAIGYLSLTNITTGKYNTCVGINTGAAITTQEANTFLGYGAGGSIAANRTIAIGYQAAYATSTAIDTIAIGYRAAQQISGGGNVCIGVESMGASSGTGANNVMVGSYSGYATTNGSGNIFLGNYSGRYVTTESNYLFINNTASSKSNITDERNKSLVYAKMDADPANQAFVLNGKLYLKDTNSGNYFTAVITSGAWVLTDTGSANAPS